MVAIGGSGDGDYAANLRQFLAGVGDGDSGVWLGMEAELGLGETKRRREQRGLGSPFYRPGRGGSLAGINGSGHQWRLEAVRRDWGSDWRN